MPFERGSCFSSSGTRPGAFAVSGTVAIEVDYIVGWGFCNLGMLGLTSFVAPTSCRLSRGHLALAWGGRPPMTAAGTAALPCLVDSAPEARGVIRHA